ncbi:MAG: tRNA (adenosine(37)-N6)-dimethylallyltransferase MiaA [Lentimicrobium sp.]|jgi:tRNA dimethylallyltransferase|nr:tRNA (adenosine(37)-N6)-dimethylallyltransferase MiaA [Lentimicrobium sp.]
MKEKNMIVILGPTASGKTRIAALVANQLGGEIISADSRQIYRGMDLGTGKDIIDYTVDGKVVPHHLIDIRNAGERYSIFDFNRDFEAARVQIQQREKQVVVCGGSGMYLETTLGLYTLKEAPEDAAFREEAASMADADLIALLQSISKTHNTSDLTDRSRLIRAIEVARVEASEDQKIKTSEGIISANLHHIFGISFPRDETRQRITQRLEERLKNSMLNEVEKLLNSGIAAEDLIYYGLEYKYLTLYLTGKISYSDMFRMLNTAIHQFAKRQMTWFRRMEKKGLNIRWLDGRLGHEKCVEAILSESQE